MSLKVEGPEVVEDVSVLASVLEVTVGTVLKATGLVLVYGELVSSVALVLAVDGLAADVLYEDGLFSAGLVLRAGELFPVES